MDETSEKYDIEGSPTLIFLKNGKPIEYTETNYDFSKISQDLVNWVVRKM